MYRLFDYENRHIYTINFLLHEFCVCNILGKTINVYEYVLKQSWADLQWCVSTGPGSRSPPLFSLFMNVYVGHAVGEVWWQRIT
jgi:hypothetical protein